MTSAPAGISCGTTCSDAFANGTSVTLTAHAGTGSSFVGWSGACTGKQDSCTVDLTAALTATATFAKACVVPNVKGESLKAAEHALTASGCRAGTITHAASGKVKKGRVVSERPKPGKKLAHGAKVGLVLSKGRPKHK